MAFKDIKIEPKDLVVFGSNPDQNHQPSLVTHLKIVNESDSKNIAYKVKTTAPKNYVVKPNQGIVEQGNEVSVQITMIPSLVSI